MLEQYINELKSVRAAIEKLTADPTATTSLSSGSGGSYSASFVDLDKLYRRENVLVSRIASMARYQAGGGDVSLSYGIYCGA